jgi:hypothetical protein
MFNNGVFFFENRIVYEIMWKNIAEPGRLPTGENMAHAHYMLGTYCYKRTTRTCNTYCFSTAKIFSRSRLNVTFFLLKYVS